MEFSLPILAHFVHVLGAILWAGAAVFFAFFIAPAVRDAGPAGGAVMQAALRRGGFGRFFGPVSTLTVLAGLYLYWRGEHHEFLFENGPNTALTLGMLLGLAAWIEGLAVLMPNERRLKALVQGLPAQGPPPPDALARFQGLAERQSRASRMSAMLLMGAMLLMAGRWFLA